MAGYRMNFTLVTFVKAKKNKLQCSNLHYYVVSFRGYEFIFLTTTPQRQSYISRNIWKWLHRKSCCSLPERHCRSHQLCVHKQKYRSTYKHCVSNTWPCVYPWNWNMQHNMRVQYLYCCCKHLSYHFVSLTGGTLSPSISTPPYITPIFC